MSSLFTLIFRSPVTITGLLSGANWTPVGGGASSTQWTTTDTPTTLTGFSSNSWSNSLIGVVNIPTSVTSIGDSAFDSCTSLSSITIPSSVRSIGDGAFIFCSGLSSITIPSSVISIGFAAFMYCDSLTSISVNSSNPSYSNYNNDGNLYNKQKTILIQYAIGKSDVSFTIPSSVTSIGPIAFYYCTSLTSITIPTSVTSIGDRAFDLCSLTSITFDSPSNVTNIGLQAFESCGLTSIIIPSSVISIGESAFSCYSLTSITIPSSVTSINDYAFDGITNSSSTIVYTPITPTSSYAYTYFQSNPAKFGNITYVNYITTTITPAATQRVVYSVTSVVQVTPTSNSNGAFTYSLAPGYPRGTTINSTTGQVTIGDSGTINVLVTQAPTETFTGVSTPVAAGTILVNPFPCFKSGTKIQTMKGYVPIETLRNGDLVNTLKDGYIPISMIGKREIENVICEERIKDKLYVCKQSEYPELFEDLVITGCHAILEDEFKNKEEREKSREVLGDIFVTDAKYRLPACVDSRASAYEKEGKFTIYHIALEHPDYYMNYGIYANGLLVETCSKRYLKELSNMTLL
jgi:BspA type Leucine rich repeat region (6 copies)/Hint domain